MVYLRNCWYVAGFIEEACEKPFGRKILNEELVFFRSATDGKPVALGNRCPHRFGPLDQGVLVDGNLQCPYHGLQFGRDGSCVHAPTGDAVPPNTRVPSYPLVDRHALLWIWMGETSLADPALIPDFSYLEDPTFGWFNGTLYARANYQLMVDNLLDLSHAEFLHPLLSAKGYAGRNQARVEQGERSVKIYNVAENDPIIPLMAQAQPGIDPIGTSTQLERWEAPSMIELLADYTASNGRIVMPSGHFLTPETDQTTHYFVRGGQNFAPHSAEVTEMSRQGVLGVFRTQDIPMVESQQIHLGDRDLLDASPAILKSDKGAIRVRRLLAKLIRDEAALAPPATEKPRPVVDIQPI